MSTSAEAGQAVASPQNEAEALREKIRDEILAILRREQQPGASELLTKLEGSLGWKVRAELLPAIKELRGDKTVKGFLREYLTTTTSDAEVEAALRGDADPRHEFKSTLDDLLRKSAAYRKSEFFQAAVEFTAKFRAYAPYNNMLVKVQRPSCSFYATEKHWADAFKRVVKEDARPMLILAPMHPVMLVYDLDDTEGPPLPKKFLEFASAEGDWNPKVLENTLLNAERDRILAQFKPLSSTHGGFATTRLRDGRYKMRVVIHEELPPKSRYAILCHELAHIYLGHLGSDKDRWWPCRIHLSHATVEIEAEAVAYIVSQRAGLVASSAAYLSSFIKGPEYPEMVSMELIAKVAGKLGEMGARKLPMRKPKGQQAFEFAEAGV